jgi:NADH-quinone oxidoreductase subunit H
MFFMAEYMHIVTISAIAVTLFWGGWQPIAAITPKFLPALWPTVWFLLKVSAFVFLFYWLRASLPRLRYDQLMNIGWKVLIPLGMAWIPLSAATRIIDLRRWIVWVIGALIGLIILSLFVPQKRDEEERSEEKVSA